MKKQAVGPPPMKEQALKMLIKNYLLLKGHFVWVNNSGMTRTSYTSKNGVVSNRAWRAGIRGSSDILGIEKGTGRFIAIETKVGYNKPTPDQTVFLEDIASRGGHAIVAYSIADVQKYL
jgi:hypothetical protein